MAKTPQPKPIDTLPSDGRPARLDAIRAELAAYDDVELPPEIREWLAGFVGCLDIPFGFDPDTYFSEGWGPYGTGE
jgi:hypothetical protein